MLPLPGQRIAIAQDRAFAFYYSFIVDAWRSAGAEILPFSPLADQAPAIHADAIYLPGGYPELYAGQLAASRTFLTGLHRAAQRNILIYGECGGFMVLGEELIDADGQPHIMAGLLPVQTSFAKPGLHLAYQQLQLLIDTPLGQSGSVLRGQEFHFARLLSGTSSRPLFRSRDVAGNDLGDIGECSGPVMGSFVHLLDRID
jgi:cobyrinic acid a,c-diamide synthase